LASVTSPLPTPRSLDVGVMMPVPEIPIGSEPTSPVTVMGPVRVTPSDPRTEKAAASPSRMSGGPAARAELANDTAATTITVVPAATAASRERAGWRVREMASGMS
jgi:hypothetical protein